MKNVKKVIENSIYNNTRNKIAIGYFKTYASLTHLDSTLYWKLQAAIHPKVFTTQLRNAVTNSFKNV